MKLFLLIVMILKRYREVGREGGSCDTHPHCWISSFNVVYIQLKMWSSASVGAASSSYVITECKIICSSPAFGLPRTFLSNLLPVQYIAAGPRQHSRSWYRVSSGLCQYGLLFNERKGPDYHWSLPLYWRSESAGFHSHSTLYPLTDCCYRKSNTGVLE
jgi:hypothetical protein